uniref:Uncharacterized protein n=1 Tax=Tanacetum cinerariifolium TaxID=118510 RepID=A0A6L2KVS0_TANCI|nr:hypothetical protein [Tanacetum cinerariifolium]
MDQEILDKVLQSTNRGHRAGRGNRQQSQAGCSSSYTPPPMYTTQVVLDHIQVFLSDLKLYSPTFAFGTNQIPRDDADGDGDGDVMVNLNMMTSLGYLVFAGKGSGIVGKGMDVVEKAAELGEVVVQVAVGKSGVLGE